MAETAYSYISTATTRGGMSFDQLCRGDAPLNYVVDKECLVEITKKDTLAEAEEKLVRKIDDLFEEIEVQKGRKIIKFYIGKTYVRTVKNSKTVKPLSPRTWKKGGISSRWGEHQSKEYGKHGMIVIAAITRSQVPTYTKLNGSGKPVTNQEQYTLALEQRLVQHYLITEQDDRIENKTFTCGGTDGKGSAGYVLYVAFRLEDECDDKGSENAESCPEDDGSEANTSVEQPFIYSDDNQQFIPAIQDSSTRVDTAISSSNRVVSQYRDNVTENDVINPVPAYSGNTVQMATVNNDSSLHYQDTTHTLLNTFPHIPMDHLQESNTLSSPHIELPNSFNRAQLKDMVQWLISLHTASSTQHSMHNNSLESQSDRHHQSTTPATLMEPENTSVELNNTVSNTLCSPHTITGETTCNSNTSSLNNTGITQTMSHVHQTSYDPTTARKRHHCIKRASESSSISGGGAEPTKKKRPSLSLNKRRKKKTTT